ncbi:MAG: pantoate--beta-alanine ligase [Bacteroidia bacterium]|nr:pantoate--beta-alanine ligase [Bacteroidia bacterium]
MIVFKKIPALKTYLKNLRNQNLTIGFVPTMGALHDGHISLIQAATDRCDITVCSIFVNPTQFNQKSDLDKYPYNITADLNRLLDHDTDVVFIPDADEIYPEGDSYEMSYDLGGMDEILEGAKRPGHFEGVVQVVDLLLQIVGPDQLFMGQKDFQQFSIIQKMLELQESKIELVVCPIIREKDGLAMSSRNVRLTEKDRRDALQLNRTLLYIKNHIFEHPIDDVLTAAKRMLESPNMRLEYLTIVDVKTLQEVYEIKPEMKTVALIAAWVGDVRLIDNMILRK